MSSGLLLYSLRMDMNLDLEICVTQPDRPFAAWKLRLRPESMVWQPRNRRYTTTASRTEVNIRAIPMLPPGGWKLCTLEEVPVVGAVPKNYLTYGEPYSSTSHGFFAKKGRLKADARECVTEEIISKIGEMLPLKMASSKLVRVSKYDVRFLSRNFVMPGRNELIHGIELVARYFETNPSEVESAFDLSDRRAEEQFYTIRTILTILQDLYPSEFPTLKAAFFKMLAFDAFVGAPDRHAMNWGVLVPVGGNPGHVRFAPIFDTARGLFREHSDEDLRKKADNQGRERFLESYANRSRPIFSTGRVDQDNHFSLVKWVAEEDRDACMQTMGTVFDSVDLRAIERMLQRKFRRIITQVRIDFILSLLEIRVERLRKEIRT